MTGVSNSGDTLHVLGDSARRVSLGVTLSNKLGDMWSGLAGEDAQIGSASIVSVSPFFFSTLLVDVLCSLKIVQSLTLHSDNVTCLDKNL